MKIVEINIYKGTNTTFLFFFNTNIFKRYICKMYIIADSNETAENQDLYRNKDDF